MRLATWNVNGLRARLDFVFHWLSSRQPDVVGLQELKVSEDQFPYSKFEAEGYHTVVHAQKAWNGVAILSRECPKIEQKGLPGQEDFGARLVSASIGSLSFATVYCPNGKQVGHADFFRKLHWFESLADYLRQKIQLFSVETLISVLLFLIRGMRKNCLGGYFILKRKEDVLIAWLSGG